VVGHVGVRGEVDGDAVLPQLRTPGEGQVVDLLHGHRGRHVPCGGNAAGEFVDALDSPAFLVRSHQHTELRGALQLLQHPAGQQPGGVAANKNAAHTLGDNVFGLRATGGVHPHHEQLRQLLP